MTSLTIYRRLLQLTRPYWPHLAGLFALTFLAVPIALLTPFPLKLAVDSAIGSAPLPAVLVRFLPADLVGSWRGVLLLCAILLVGLAILSQVQMMYRALLNTYLADRLVLRFRTELFRQVQRLSLSYHDATGSTDSLYRIQYDATAIQYIAIEGVIPFVVSFVTVVSMLFVVWQIDAQLALVSLAVIPLLSLAMRHYRPQLRKHSRQVKHLESTAMSVVQETLGALRVVKAFGQEDREQTRFASRSRESLDARLRLARAERTMGMWVGVIMAVGSAATLYVGVGHVKAGTLSMGNLLLVLGYVGSLYGPLKSVSGKVARLQNHLASAERAFALLDQAPEVVEKPGARPLVRARGDLRFDDVSFAYGADAPVLHHVSFVTPVGTRVGIAGPTGAGKTTLVNLLLRLYDPTSGKVELDGVDLRDLKVADLRNQFSIVLQEPVLFSTSIAENTAYAKPDATRVELEAAARAANAHHFITALPQGYDTLVGERGMRLSGGERQRISLARAFLKNAPVLILDEPTSSVDAATEAEIMDAIGRLTTGRTSFMITHRAATLAYCDVVLRVQSGRVHVDTPPTAAPGAAGAGRSGVASA
jgi:ATP-binding cassette subfamily B protein